MATTWNLSPAKAILKVNAHQTHQDPELLRFKIELEDEIKANPASRQSQQFYESLTHPFVENEPDIPP
ncbi:hypothetical protein KQI58_16350 [Enterococcus raffinosus]|jgi:hypothetical protein|uniref:hypothetical protein n=1 Tax=Enterococcus raffinosus TaxID=71452 RepID=UPI001C12927B|nr:hypothetical protein [Enterococcus raffinosus]MBU5362645.1 hypothetical protein [Enterococcus raffinosus]